MLLILFLKWLLYIIKLYEMTIVNNTVLNTEIVSSLCVFTSADPLVWFVRWFPSSVNSYGQVIIAG